MTPSGFKPVVVSSANGNVFKNGGDMTGVQKAFTLMTQGSDVLDALVTGVNILELDPTEDSVGLRGLPNAEGVVQLDSCCMHGPRKQAGGVARSKGSAPPRSSPRRFWSRPITTCWSARGHRNSPTTWVEDRGRPEHRRSRQLWLEWKRRTDPNHYLDPKQRSEAVFRRRSRWRARDSFVASTSGARSTATG